jgi:hypothetical protein
MKNPIIESKKAQIAGWISAVCVAYLAIILLVGIYMKNDNAISVFLASGATLGAFAWLGITPEWFAERWVSKR